MEKIRREKVHLAVKGACDMYEELGLTMEEREIVSRSLCVTAKAVLLKEQLESEAEEMIQKETAFCKIMRMLPTITSTAAILISIASLLAKLLL